MGPDVLEIHSYTPPRSGSLVGHIAFCMADVPEALKALARPGIGAAPGYPRPARGNSGSIALVYGPDGNEVELLDRRPLHRGASPSAAFGTDEQPAEVAVGR